MTTNIASDSKTVPALHAGPRAPHSAAKPVINLYDRTNPVTATVEFNERITDPKSESDIHHVVLNFNDHEFPYLEGQNIGIIPPGENKRGRPHPARMYSVASARDGEKRGQNNLALTVKRVFYSENGEQKSGLCSNYVCDLKPGDQVKVTGPFGDTFLMPNHPEANIIMICTGTGAAPFRAMTEYRRRHMKGCEGKLKLYFGARTPGELPYFDPLSKLHDSLINKHLIFSRVPDAPKKYVQHHMISQADELDKLMRSPETYIYVCGLREMELGVEEAFDEICNSGGCNWSKVKEAMYASGRYHVETY